MDIDQIIVGDVEKILNYPVHSKELITYDAGGIQTITIYLLMVVFINLNQAV